MPNVRWRLADYLERHRLTAYALGKDIGVTRMNTVYRIARRGSEPVRVDLETLGLVISSLRKLTGEDVQLTDILEYDPSGTPEPQAVPPPPPEPLSDPLDPVLDQLRALKLSDAQLTALLERLRAK